MSNTSSFHWHNIFSFYPAPNLIKLTLYLIWSWKYERYVPPCLKFYVFLKYHSAPFLQPTFLSWIRNNLMFYPFLERNPSGETQLKSLKKNFGPDSKVGSLTFIWVPHPFVGRNRVWLLCEETPRHPSHPVDQFLSGKLLIFSRGKDW